MYLQIVVPSGHWCFSLSPATLDFSRGLTPVSSLVALHSTPIVGYLLFGIEIYLLLPAYAMYGEFPCTLPQLTMLTMWD